LKAQTAEDAMRFPFRAASALLVPGLSMLACASEYALHAAPPELLRPGGPIDPIGPNGPPMPPNPPAPPSSPWDDLNPGDLPEVYFGIAYGDPWCGQYYDGAAETDEDWGGCAVRYAVIDLRGQVVAEFDLPGQQQGAYWEHLELSPAGPGKLLAVAWGYEDVYGGMDPDGFWAETPWRAFLLDAVQRTITPFARWDSATGMVRFDGHERSVDLPGSSWLQMRVRPDDPSRVYVWGTGDGCTGIGNLKEIVLGEPQMLPRIWRPIDLLPPDYVYPMPAAWNLDVSLDDDGRASLMLGFSQSGCYGGGASRVRVLDPDAGFQWEADLHVEGWPASATYAGWRGGGVLTIASPWADPQWVMTGPDGVAGGPLGGTALATAGPVLDPEGPTFLVTRTRTDGQGGNEIEIWHRGERVWTIPGLRFGLGTQIVSVLGLSLVQPPEAVAE
jgi:hypothetical protein